MNLALLSNQDTPAGTKAIEYLISSLNLKGSSAAFIASQPDPERCFFSQAQDVYESVNIELDTYIDFEDGYSDKLMSEVLSKRLVHLSGGNTYRFLSSIQSRGMTERLVNYARSGGVLIGVSAGAMLLTPSIESAALCGDVDTIGLDDLTSLDLVEFMFSPHATRQHDELCAAKQLVAKQNRSMYLCNDDESVVVINNQLHLFGKPTLLNPAGFSA